MFAAITLSLTSCLKDKGYDDLKYGINQDVVESQKIINMPVAQTTFTTPVSIAATKTTANTVTIPVHLSAKDVSSENLAITIGPSDARLATYNAGVASTATFTRLPDAKYTLSNGGVVTIPSGSRDGSLVVTFTGSTIATPGRWAIPIELKSVDKSGYVLSGNQAYRIILITVTP